MTQTRAPVCLLRHTVLHGPGYFQEVLARHGIPFFSHRVTPADPVPAGREFAALAIFGGPFDIHDADRQPWMTHELGLIRRAVDADIPVLGHSFGAELIATALGSMVVRNSVKQIGWFDTYPIRDDDRGAPWLEGIPDWLEVFKWHLQSFDIPAGATRLFKSEWDANEAFVLGNTLAFQGHLEATAEIIRTWLTEYAPEVSHPREDPHVHGDLAINWNEIVQGPEAICSNLDKRIARLHQAADLIYGRWLESLGDDRSLRV